MKRNFYFKINQNKGIDKILPILPSQTPTLTTTPTVTPTITLTPTITPTTSITPSLTPTLTLTPTKSPLITPSPTITKTPTLTPTITPTNTQTPTITPSITPTISITPSVTPPPIFTNTLFGPIDQDPSAGISIISNSNELFYFYEPIDPGGNITAMIIQINGVQQMTVTFGDNRIGQYFGFRQTSSGPLFYAQLITGVVNF